MQHIILNNGVGMPCIGLGVFQSPPDETKAAVEAAVKVGYRHIDTAASYNNEREVGQAHSARPSRPTAPWRRSWPTARSARLVSATS
jgi:diketogulonate reductase-like aldo/keto reductase